jgi:hypothetical protein
MEMVSWGGKSRRSKRGREIVEQNGNGCVKTGSHNVLGNKEYIAVMNGMVKDLIKKLK